MAIDGVGSHMQSSQLSYGIGAHLHSQNTAEKNADKIGSTQKDNEPKQDTYELTQEELKQVQQLEARDSEVRAHEAAHASIGGQYAGSPSFSYQRGPNGKSYAIGGEVSIDVSNESSPQATIRKMEIVARAALAPAEPSPQDRQVAQAAQAIKLQAQAELAAKPQKEAIKTDKANTREDGMVENSAATDKTPEQLKTEQLFNISPTQPSTFSIQA